jgi:hypothetical protein
VESSRRPAAVVFVNDSAAPDPWLVASPRSVVDLLRSEPAHGDAWAPMPWPARAAWAPPVRSGRLGVVVPSRDRYLAATARPVPDLPACAPLVGNDGRLVVQTLWVGGRGSGLWTARRWWYTAGTPEELTERFETISIAMAAGWTDAVGVPARARRLGLGSRHDWRHFGIRSIPRRAWIRLGPERADSVPEPRWGSRRPLEPIRAGHAVVLGASGAGKTCFLADQAARAIARGEPVLAIDLHGDLAPAIVARLDRRDRARVACLDLSDLPVPGISAIALGASPERAAAHLVAALKRLTPDGGEVYWGFRLERIFDSFVRLVQESGGSLLDLHALLNDPDRRDAARLATRDPDLARFLEELGPVVRRNPDFLWAASSRVAKVVSIRSLAELLAPSDGGLPVEELLAGRRSVLLRIPFALLGPEAAAFAGTLVLARIYLGLAARSSEGAPLAPTTVVLDEVQGLSPRLVAEMLAEGRKFGFRVVVATQFPDRLAPELRSAVTGVVREFVAFRVPRPGAIVAGGWLGLGPADAERSLVDLPPGHGFARGPDDSSIQPVAPVELPSGDERAGWSEAVRATRAEFGTPTWAEDEARGDDPVSERLLLAVLGAEEEGRPLALGALTTAAGTLPGPRIDAAALVDRIRPLERRGYIRLDPDGVRLAPAGERRLGLGAPTGAVRESAEHRALLLGAFRIFARRGHRLEIVRQGRFDTRLPDALFRQIPVRARQGSPEALAETLDRLRQGWAWRFFGGRDVHLEAEVSGALRPARIRHGLAKATARGAFALFLVSDARRATRVRATLRRLRAGVDTAQVWTLHTAAEARPFPSPEARRSPVTGTTSGAMRLEGAEDTL